MSNNDQRAHCRRQIIMGVFVPDNIFREVVWLYQLADIMKIGASAAHCSIGTDSVGRNLCEVSYHVAVMPGTGSLETKAQKNGVVTIGHFQPRPILGNLEH